MKVRRIDVRDLEPPQPMVRIAREIEKLGENEVLEVLGLKPFKHLLPRLRELGFSYELTEVPEGYLLRIWRSGRETPGKVEELRIDENTNVGELIERYPEALEILIRFGFTPLRSRVLRKLLPHTVTLGQAKRIRRMSDEKFRELLEELRKLQEKS